LASAAAALVVGLGVPLVAVVAAPVVASATTSGCSLDVSSVQSAYYGVTPFTLGATDSNGYSAMFSINCGSAPSFSDAGWGPPQMDFQVAAGGVFGSWGTNLIITPYVPAGSYTVGRPFAVSCVASIYPYGSASAAQSLPSLYSSSAVYSWDGALCSSGGVSLMIGFGGLNTYSLNYDSACPQTTALGVWINGPYNSATEIQCSSVDSINGNYRPCSNVLVAGDGNAQPGASYSYNFQWEGQCTEFAIASQIDPTFSTAPQDYTPSLSTGSSSLSYVFDGFTAGNSSGGLFSLSVNLTNWTYSPLPVFWTTFPDQAEVWAAYGKVGSLTWVDVGPLAGLLSSSGFSSTGVAPTYPGSTYSSAGGGSSPPGSFGACVASAGMSLTDPLSWVTGAMEIGRCTLVVLFVPSSASVSSLTNLFGITSNDPTGSVGASAWLGSMVRILASAPASEVAAVQTVADSGSCYANAPSVPSMTIGGQSIGVCAILSAPSTVTNQNASGWLTFLKDVLSVAIYGGAALLLFGLVRRMLGSS